MSNTKEPLFKEFQPVSLEEWEKVIEHDLHGANYKKKLIWHTGEGVDLLPFYRRESLKDLDRETSIPKTYANGNANSWEVREPVFEGAIDTANQTIREALNRGADGLQLYLRVHRTEGMLGGDLQGIPIQSQKAFSKLFQNISIENIPLHFDAGLASPALLAMLWNETQRQNLNPKKVRSTFSYDPFVFLLAKGHYPKKKDPVKHDIRQLVSFAFNQLPAVRPLCIDARRYHNSGATIVQELAYAMASASEYLSILTEAGFKADEAAGHLHFSFSVGSSYFLEIAKLRAVRILWKNLIEAYGGTTDSRRPHLHGETSNWNKTLYDPYSNMLRTSTETMSAAIGGCDSITVHPFDDHYRNPEDFSKRIARNQQLILSEEAYLDRVSDPSAGSYYIEKITDALGRNAWNLFREIEAEGGLFKAIENGTVQSAIQESQQRRNEEIATRNRIFVGTNQYSNPEETPPGNTTKDSKPTVSLKASEGAFEHKKNEESLIEFLARALNGDAQLGNLVDHLFNYQKQEYRTVQPYRGAMAFEALRQATEEYGTVPSVLTLPLGNRKMRKARAAFAANFFGCAGYHIDEPVGFESLEEATAAINEKKPDIIVLCSSDEEYQELVPGLGRKLEHLENKPITVLAGNPKGHSDTYREAGVDAFIYAGSNVLEMLRGFQKQLGIIQNDE